jgi:hypothetical protein
VGFERAGGRFDMKPMRSAVFVAGCGLAIFACGYDFERFTPTNEAGVGQEGGATQPDGGREGSGGGPDATSGTDSANGTDSASGDGAGDAPTCPSTSVSDDFTTLDAGTWIQVGSVTLAEAGTVDLVPANQPYVAGALWLRMPQTFDKFDISFRARVAHADGGPPASDGFTFVWLHDSVGDAAPTDSTANRALGVPPGFAGYGVEFDIYRVMRGYLDVDPTLGYPGQYAWEVPGTLQALDFSLNAWHEVSVRLRGGALTVTTDGTSWSADATGYQPFLGYVGFTAHSGAAGDAYEVSAFSATFESQACDP